MSTTRRLKNLALNLSANRKKLRNIEDFIFRIEHKENTISNCTMRNEVISNNIKTKPTNEAFLSKINKKEESLKKKYKKLMKDKQKLNERIIACKKKKKIEAYNLDNLKKKVEKLNYINEIYENNVCIYYQQTAMNEQLFCDLLELNNSERRLNIEERQGILNNNKQSENYDGSLKIQQIHLNEEQELRKIDIYNQYFDILELIEKNKHERKQCEKQYIEKANIFTNMIKKSRNIDDIKLQLYTMQYKNDILGDNNMELKSVLLTKERNKKSISSFMNINNSACIYDNNIDSNKIYKRKLKENIVHKQEEIRILEEENTKNSILLEEKRRSVKAIEKEVEEIKLKIDNNVLDK